MKHILLLTLALACCGVSRAADDAGQIIADYQKLPFDNPSRAARVKQLEKLEHATGVEEAVGAAIAAAPEPGRRAELAETLRYFPTPAAGKILVNCLKDDDPFVRNTALRSIRQLARRVDVSGERREQRGGEFEPKVPDLVPHIVAATEDADENVRATAVYALADTRDPTAVKRLRELLKNNKVDVRFLSACMLSEFHDASGLDELKSSLKRIQQDRQNIRYYSDAGLLIAAMERLTGKSFGKPPMNPHYSSFSGAESRDGPRYERILDAWAKWWEWKPEDAK